MATIKHPNAQTLLEFANLQAAAEAFLLPLNSVAEDPKNHKVKRINFDKDNLKFGNKHSTKFAPSMVDDFVGKWKVVDHIDNTATGFSGTLFEATKTITDSQGNVIATAGQQVISFRSTEFVEDAVHDNKMTNVKEIKEHGFAFGQISDMVDWVKKLQSENVLNSSIKVTGYSLGGHLAAALNMLQQEGEFDKDGSILRIDNTFTFNGAGVGKLDNEGDPYTQLIP